MDKDKLDGNRDTMANEPDPRNARHPVTILFSDIAGSTAYFEKKGDVAGMAMLQRHNGVVIPIIESHGGRVVKTIGDSIMACFQEGTSAVKAAARIQAALESDRAIVPEQDQFRVRVGLHMGLGLLRDDDVYGDVVNAAARVQKQAEPDQILITGALLECARSAGLQCANFGKAELRGKDESIDIYAVAWSRSSADQLIEEIKARMDAKLKQAKRKHDELEEQFERDRDRWRAERKRLNSELERAEDALEKAGDASRRQAHDETFSEIRFELDAAVRARDELQKQLASAGERWNAERAQLNAQIASMQASVIDAMERSNNPARAAAASRELIDARIAEAKKDWQLQADADRRRLLEEIERLKKTTNTDERKEAARRALLERLGKIPAGAASSPPAPSVNAAENDRQEWDAERERLTATIRRLEAEIHRLNAAGESVRHQPEGQDPELIRANAERQRLEQQIHSLSSQFQYERESLRNRITELENLIPQAQAAARRQALAELRSDSEAKMEEATRLRSRTERKYQELSEELESERMRASKRIAHLEQELKETREALFKAVRSSRNGTTES